MNEPHFRPLVVNVEDIPDDLSQQDITDFVCSTDFITFKKGDDLFNSVRKYKSAKNDQARTDTRNIQTI